MTATTVSAEFAIVNIVCSVAAATVAASVAHRAQGPAVTVVASGFDVCTGQREICLLVVIELPGIPVDRVVARAALGGEAPVVRVFIGVAVDAKFGSVTKNVGFVAAFTLGIRMLTE